MRSPNFAVPALPPFCLDLTPLRKSVRSAPVRQSQINSIAASRRTKSFAFSILAAAAYKLVQPSGSMRRDAEFRQARDEGDRGVALSGLSYSTMLKSGPE